MANYQSSYTGSAIDRAGKLPDPSSGSVGQFLKKNDSSGNMIFADIGGSLIFTNISITTSTWAADTTYPAYPWKADITCTGVTTSYYPQVTFNVTEAISGNFAPVSETVSNNTIRIWANTKPTKTIIIPSVIAIRS